MIVGRYRRRYARSCSRVGGDLNWSGAVPKASGPSPGRGLTTAPPSATYAGQNVPPKPVDVTVGLFFTESHSPAGPTKTPEHNAEGLLVTAPVGGPGQLRAENPRPRNGPRANTTAYPALLPAPSLGAPPLPESLRTQTVANKSWPSSDLRLATSD